MPRLECPVEGCDWQFQDLDNAFAAALATALQMNDKAAPYRLQAQPAPPISKLKLDPPTVAAGCDPDQWSAFTRQ